MTTAVSWSVDECVSATDAQHVELQYDYRRELELLANVKARPMPA